MSGRRTALLAAALLAIGLYFALVEGFRVERPVPEGQQGEKLLDCGSGPPSALAVTSGRGRISARRVEDRWDTAARGLAPVSFGALADALCRLPIIEHFDDVANLADFGLDPAAATVDISIGGGVRRLLVGATSPASNLMYVKLADRPEVLKVGAELESNVERVAGYAGSAESSP